MIIRTAQDRALVSEGCCCPLPGAGIAPVEYVSLAGFAEVVWARYDSSPLVFYQTWRRDWSDGGFEQYRYSQPYRAVLGMCEITEAGLIYTEGDPKTGTLTESKLEPIDVAAARVAGFGDLEDEVNLGDLTWEREDLVFGSEVSARRQDHTPSVWSPVLCTARWVSYRMTVPYEEGEGRSYYEMEWDEVKASEDWWIWHDAPDLWEGDPPAGGPALVRARSWLWNGDMETPKSDWYVMEPPESGYETRIANLRVKGWRSERLGVAPEVYGDVVELP